MAACIEVCMWLCDGMCWHAHLTLCKHFYACLVCVIITASTVPFLYLDSPIYDIHTSLTPPPPLKCHRCRFGAARLLKDVLYNVTQQSLLTYYCMSGHVTVLCCSMLCLVMLCNIMLCYSILYLVMFCHVTFCHVILQYLMSCYFILW